MFTKVAVVALLAVASVSAKGGIHQDHSVRAVNANSLDEWRSTVMREGQPVDFYDCSGKRHGDYDHPWKCDHFISCTENEDAYEMPCAPMDGNGNLLHYVQGSGPDYDTSRCDWPEVAQCTPGTPPTEGTTTTTTQAPDTCNADECQLRGNCTSYDHCVDGHWQERQCGEDLFWNPDVSSVHGGACDFWENLSEATKTRYEAQCNIPPCTWTQTPEQVCTRNYIYREKFTGKLSGRETVLECPEGLIWLGEPENTCGHCEQRKDADCCNKHA